MIDEIDRQILKILKENGRTPFLKIAKNLSLSEGTIRKRVKTMLDNGTIVKFSAELARELQFDAVICIKCDPKRAQEIISKIKEMHGEKEFIFEVAGIYDIIMHTQTEKADEMNELIDDIGALEGVKETESFTVMKKH